MSTTPFPRLTKRIHRTYRNLWESEEEHIKSLFQELAREEKMPYGRMKAISEQTGIPQKTLEDWRRRLTNNESVPPLYCRGSLPLKVTVETEREVAKGLAADFVKPQKFCPPIVLKVEIERRVAELTGEKIDAGRTYVKNFLQRQGLSMRSPHVQRRAKPDDEKVAQFIEDIDLASAELPESRIYNVDETCWRVVNGRLKTLATRGQDEVIVTSDGNPKTDVTVICACSRAGDRLPLYMVAKGKTEKCTKRYKESPHLRRHFASHDLVIDFSSKGWSTHEVMKRFLKWLRDYNKGQRFFVVWDVHASHRHESVLEWARNHDIGIAFVPAGQTGTWQPLDRRIFGSLKARSQRILKESAVNESFDKHDIMNAIGILVRAWKEISEDEIRNAWTAFD